MTGEILGHYRILSQIGSGGMGAVYQAQDLELGREVAIKVLPPELARNPERLERFRREARALAALNHPNIVTFHSVEEAEGCHFITMELVKGKSLLQMIPRGGIEQAVFLEFALQLSDALAAAHRKGISHRDLKPANVMIDENGRVKVIDFGLAKAVAPDSTVDLSQASTEEQLTLEGRILGTPAYMSPEQIEGRPVDHRTDIFALGVLFHEMLTGDKPFKGNSKMAVMAAILKDKPPSIARLRPATPVELSRIVEGCLRKLPEERFQSAREVREQLLNLTAGTAGTLASSRLARWLAIGRREASAGRRRWALGVATVLLVGALAAWITVLQLRGFIVVQVPAAGGLTAEVTVRNRNAPADVQTVPLVNGAAELKVKSGNSYDVLLTPNGEYHRLPRPPPAQIAISPRARKTNEFAVEFATLQIAAARNSSGDAVTADLTLGSETNRIRLPATLYLSPTNRPYPFSIDPDEASKVYPTNFAVLLDRPGERPPISLVLQNVIAGLANVSFRADASLPLTYRFGTNQLELGRDAFRAARNFRQGETITVSVQPPHPWREIITDWTVPDVSTVEFPRGYLNTNTLVELNWTSGTDPDKTEVLVGIGAGEMRPIGTLVSARRSVFPPQRLNYRFAFQRFGYKSVTLETVAVKPDISNPVAVPELEPLFGIVELAANLPAFKVFTNGVLLVDAAGTNAVVQLPPQVPVDLDLVYSNDFGMLPDRRVTSRVPAGETNRQAVVFDFVQVAIVPEPAEAMIARIGSAGEHLPVRGGMFIQAPGLTNRFRVSAEHFEPQVVALGNASPTRLRQVIALKPLLYEVFLVAEPSGTMLVDPNSHTPVRAGLNQLPFGQYEFVARHPMLGELSKRVSVDPSMVVTQRWALPYGTVNIVTGQEGLAVKILPDDATVSKRIGDLYDHEWPRDNGIDFWQTPIANASLPPGAYTVIFRDGEERATNRIEVALNRTVDFSFPEVVFLPPAYTNSLGMRFLRIPGQSAYISEAPVTRREFNKVLDPTGQFPVIRGELAAVTDEVPTGGNSGTLPAASLANIGLFCRSLSQAESALFRQQLRNDRWEYDLPELREWQAGAQASQFRTHQFPAESGGLEELREIVRRDGRHVEVERSLAQNPLPIGVAAQRLGRTDLGFRVVIRRKIAAQ